MTVIQLYRVVLPAADWQIRLQRTFAFMDANERMHVGLYKLVITIATFGNVYCAIHKMTKTGISELACLPLFGKSTLQFLT